MYNFVNAVGLLSATLLLVYGSMTKIGQEGEDVLLPCGIQHQSIYTWYIHNTAAVNRVVGYNFIPPAGYRYLGHLNTEDGARANINETTGNLTIFITRLIPKSDEYLYICTPYTQTEPFYQVTLTIHVNTTSPIVTDGEDTVVAGEEYTASCEVKRIKPANITMISWSADGVTIDPGNVETTEHSNNDTTKRLVSVVTHRFSAGKAEVSLTCIVDAEADGQQSVSKDITVNWAPFNSFVTNNSEPFPGSALTLTCIYSEGNPIDVQTIRWTRDDQNITEANEQDLVLSDLSEADNGEYKCYVSNSVGEGNSYTSHIVTVYKTHMVNITGTDPDNVIEGQENVTIQCDAHGGDPNQILSVEWEKDGESLPEENIHYLDYVIPEVQRGDAGNYMCRVKNFEYETGWANSSQYNLDVKYPPFWKGPNEVGGITGQPLMVTCTVCANPEPYEWQWTYRGTSQDNITDLNNGSIVINSFTEEYEGNYSCRVNNNIGTTPPVFWIIVKEAGPPCTPEEFQALDNITSTTITVQWTPGCNGGYPQTFTLEYKEVSGDYVIFEDEIEDTGDTIVRTVINLEPETTYDFRVTAKNHEGENDPAETKGHQTKAKPNIKLGEITVTTYQMVVKWTYTEPGMRTKRNTNILDTENIGVAVEYKKSSDNTYIRYPEEGTVDAGDEEVTIDGSFDESADYAVRLIVCEGDWVCSEGEETVHEAPGDDFPVAIVAGVLGGVAGIALIVVVVVLVIRPRVRSSHDTYNPDKPVELNSKDDEVAGEPGVDNPTIQENGATDPDMIVYETSPIARTPNQANSTPTPVSNGVEPLYSEVDKNKNKNKSKTSDDPNALYAQPDKTKKKTQEDESTPLYAEVDHKKKKKKKKAAPTPEPTYAEVKKPPKDKGKGKKKTSPAKPENAYENVDKSGAAKMSDSVPAEAAYETVDDLKKKSSKPPPPLYDNTPTIDVNKDDGAYSEVELRPPEDKTAGKIIGPDGTLYTEVSFARDEADRKKPGKPPKPTKPVIRRTEEPTEYASIDFTKKAPALEETEEDVAEEVKPEEKKKEEMAFGESKINEDGELEALV